MARTKNSDGPNKMQLVREAMETLGVKSKPVEIAKHIKDKHGLEVSTSMISTYKSIIQKPAKGDKAAKPAKETTAKAGPTNIADDVVTLRKLVTRLGARQLHQLIDVLS